MKFFRNSFNEIQKDADEASLMFLEHMKKHGVEYGRKYNHVEENLIKISFSSGYLSKGTNFDFKKDLKP